MIKTESEEEIKKILDYATDPANRLSNDHESTLVVTVRRLLDEKDSLSGGSYLTPAEVAQIAAALEPFADEAAGYYLRGGTGDYFLVETITLGHCRAAREALALLRRKA